MKSFKFLFLVLVLSSCGTTSNLRSPEKSSGLPCFSQYHYVIVNDFKDGVSKHSDDPYIISEGKRFADIIASLIRSKEMFDKVGRNVESTDHGLLIDGKITKHEEGSSVMRAFVGFGAGRSNFDAVVYVRDNETKRILGVIDVSKASWLLGGVLAGGQNVSSHMHSAGVKIADECALAKKRSK